MSNIDLDYLPLWRKHADRIERVQLSNEDLGALVRAMMRYQFYGIEPEKMTGTLELWWDILREDLDYARERYETSVKNGKKGGRKKKEPEQTQQNLEQGNTITESNTESITESISNTNTDTDSSASAKAEVSVSRKTYGEFGWVRLTDQEYSQLEREMGRPELHRCITYIDESAQSTGNRNHWLDWYTVLRRCYQKKWHEAARSYSKQEIPKGATGYLGEAELEAIRQVLAT
jgi:hypothetical protein